MYRNHPLASYDVNGRSAKDPAMNKPAPPRIKKFATAKQRLLDRLLEKNGEGTITRGEKTKLEQLVAEAKSRQLPMQNDWLSFPVARTASPLLMHQLRSRLRSPASNPGRTDWLRAERAGRQR
jgi:hypothetical protein